MFRRSEVYMVSVDSSLRCCRRESVFELDIGMLLPLDDAAALPRDYTCNTSKPHIHVTIALRDVQDVVADDTMDSLSIHCHFSELSAHGG